MARPLGHWELAPSGQTGRPKRQRFLPATFHDFIPLQSNISSTIPTRTRHGSTPPAPNLLSSAPASRTPSPPPEPAMLSTDPDEFGLFREYTSFPTYEPDDFASLDEICDAATFNIPPPTAHDSESGFGARKDTTSSGSNATFPSSSSSDSTNPYAPFPNASTYHMMKFAYDESNDNSFGLAGIQRVNDEIIQQPGFDPNDLRTFNAQTEAKKLDTFIASQALRNDLPFDSHAGWKRSSVTIPLPCPGHRNAEDQAPTVVIDDIIHRDLLEVMREAYSSDASSEYHLRGYKQMWQRDGRLYPRIFTYSADYPEKVLLASIKNLGTHFCPRCTTEKKNASEMGTREDMARRQSCRRVDTRNRRKMIERAMKRFFKHGKGINSSSVDNELSDSMTPTRNAFSEAFHDLGLNYFRLFVNDILHEVELGTFKDLITHLIRMCHTMGKDTVQELNQRFRSVPTFGRGTVRRFVENVSELKKLAARDFEDLLQCAPPCFEGLFAEKSQDIDDLVQDLLAHFATWHAYAKLRLHTDLTLDSFELATTELGHLLRKFAEKTAETFDTRLLPREVAARARRKANNGSDTDTPRKLFNFNTYKFHALGDYPWTIPTFGTTDSYSTQLGELEHRRIKRLYIRTNKINFTFQVARHEQRRRVLKNLLRRKNASKHATQSQASQTSLTFADSDPLPFTDPLSRYHISSNTRYSDNLTTWLGNLQDDPAFTDFLPKLKDHILERLLPGVARNETKFSEAERATVTFINNRIFRHKVVRLNYTTYDLHRNQDSCNPRTLADIMMLSGDSETCDDHPYWFAQIIGIYHVNIVYSGQQQKFLAPQKLDFLHVRWFGLAREQDGYGIHAKRMPSLGFIDAQDPEAFGFVDPSNIICACHVIPAFAYEKTSQFLPGSGSSLARQGSDKIQDYFRYYVNMWVDRDMFMRFRGGGVGHKATLLATRVFEQHNTVGLGDLEELYDSMGARLDEDEDTTEDEDEEGEEGNGDIIEVEDELGPEDGEDGGEGENLEGFADF
ncbi:hypothetical protein F5878DRAFT_665520 [Lentinula raphanica]|uniref:Uncharacterized protein n=1 Tax=Lentinula raphanica TaxID=153919 RepID=A0AA38NZM8_9AGAR|nr:hypothetical protein F5878DRAFT_665520 [Lentinula raphanica]